jgi:simple sugar transport system permease protein
MAAPPEHDGDHPRGGPIQFRADQIVTGPPSTFSRWLTVFLVNRVCGLRDIGHIGPGEGLLHRHPGPRTVPFFGPVLFQQNVVVYIALILLVGSHIPVPTRLGLRTRAVGEHPMAADTAGINVYLIRYSAVISSGLLSGLAGAFLAIGVSNTLVPNMTDGRGYIALAAVIFGKWTPFGAFIACLIFGLGQAIYDNNSTIHISPFLLSILPSILTLVVLAGIVVARPAHDGLAPRQAPNEQREQFAVDMQHRVTVSACSPTTTSISARREENHALVAGNGAGKSMLTNILYGLIHPDSGEIFITASPSTCRGRATRSPSASAWSTSTSC